MRKESVVKHAGKPGSNVSLDFHGKVGYTELIMLLTGGFIMKLIIAIVQDEDSSKLLSKLMQKGFGVTKLATTGGFLKAGNTTLLLGVEEDRIEEAVHIVETVCKSRKQITPSTTTVTGLTHGEFASFPVEVTIGGATLFVLTVDQFLKV